MSVIAAIQIAALSYGVYSAYNQRTAAIVFAENRFETLSLNEFRAAQDELEAQNLPVVPLSKFGKMPVLVHAPGYDYGKYLEDILNGKPELRERSDLYQPIRESLDLIAEFAVNERGEPIEIPASSTPTDAPATPMKFNLKARYDSAVITVYEKGFKIEQVGH
jgi:hypothetical protein